MIMQFNIRSCHSTSDLKFKHIFLWIARNDTVFNDNAWLDQKFKKSIWNAMVDNGRAAWIKTVEKYRRSPLLQDHILAKFVFIDNKQ